MRDTYHCAVCGREVSIYEDLKHRCPKRTLSAIDGANTRAELAESDATRAAVTTAPWWRTYGDRIKYGFQLLARGEDRQ